MKLQHYHPKLVLNLSPSAKNRQKFKTILKAFWHFPNQLHLKTEDWRSAGNKMGCFNWKRHIFSSGNCVDHHFCQRLNYFSGYQMMVIWKYCCWNENTHNHSNSQYHFPLTVKGKIFLLKFVFISFLFACVSSWFLSKSLSSSSLSFFFFFLNLQNPADTLSHFALLCFVLLVAVS